MTNTKGDSVGSRLLIVLLLFLSRAHAATPDFYHVVLGPNPGPTQQATDEFLCGCKLLYSNDAKTFPTKVDGIVWHASLEEMRYFVGTQNPVLENLEVLARIENDKWEEAKVLQRYVPEHFPRTESLAGLFLGTSNAEFVLAELRERYAQGFFLKPIDGFNSDGKFPSEKTDLKHPTAGELSILERVSTHPETVVVQEKIKPRFTSPGVIEEYRVHVVAGRILKGATVHRWWNDGPPLPTPGLRQVEYFVESILKRLPPEYRKMSFGVDVMGTETGEFKIVELNPGGASAYLLPEYDLWIPQLLAQHFTGKRTRLQRLVGWLENADLLWQKERILDQIIELSGGDLVKLNKENAAATTLLMRLQRGLREALKRRPIRKDIKRINALCEQLLAY